MNRRNHYGFNKMSVRFLVVILTTILVLFYLTQSNQAATRGYIVSSLEQQKKELLEENESLQLEVSRLQSISQIKQKAANLNMVVVDEVNYLEEKRGLAKK
jgi:cell division protein FtsL